MRKLYNWKVTEWALNIVLFGVLILFGIWIYWLFGEYNILTPMEGNYQLDKTVYKRGEALSIHFRICKNRGFVEDIYGKFVDGVIFSVPENTSDFEMGCYDTYISSVSIPETLPEGKYIYMEDIVYQVNPIRTIEYTFTTPEFEVIE